MEMLKQIPGCWVLELWGTWGPSGVQQVANGAIWTCGLRPNTNPNPNLRGFSFEDDLPSNTAKDGEGQSLEQEQQAVHTEPYSVNWETKMLLLAYHRIGYSFIHPYWLRLISILLVCITTRYELVLKVQLSILVLEKTANHTYLNYTMKCSHFETFKCRKAQYADQGSQVIKMIRLISNEWYVCE